MKRLKVKELKKKRKLATSNIKKQLISQEEIQYLKKYAENSAIAAFANHKLSKQQ